MRFFAVVGRLPLLYLGPLLAFIIVVVMAQVLGRGEPAAATSQAPRSSNIAEVALPVARGDETLTYYLYLFGSEDQMDSVRSAVSPESDSSPSATEKTRVVVLIVKSQQEAGDLRRAIAEMNENCFSCPTRVLVDLTGQ